MKFPSGPFNPGHIVAEEKLGKAQDNRKLFGSGKTILQVVTIDLTNSRDSIEFDFGAANFLWAIEATDDTANIEIAYNTQRSGKVPWKKGQAISGRDFNFAKVFLTNVAQSGKSITFVYGFSDNPTEFINAVESLATVNIAKSDSFTSTADTNVLTGATTQILAADTTRVEAIVTNTSPTDTVRIGDSSVAAARGTPLGPEQTIILTTTAAIHIHNPNAGTVSFAITETKD